MLDSRRLQLRSLFTGLITAYGAKDFDAFATFIAEDALFDYPYLPLTEFPSEVVGREKFIEVSQAGMANCDGYHHVVEEFYDALDPDTLIVEYKSDTVLNDGTRYRNKYLGILRFKDDKVVYWREYVNPLPILEAYGLGFANKAAVS